MINVPFVGEVRAAGRTQSYIEKDIVNRLRGKANVPQALVRVIKNNSANVTVIGDVVSSTRMPLTSRRERLLDALAAAGGVKNQSNKLSLQVTRGDVVQAMPLDAVIRDPRQNIILQPGDVVTSLFQSQSFMLLGATQKNEEINFEAQGISLSQALARAGGLSDTRADAQGIFIFRFEMAKDGAAAMPMVYQVNLKDPAMFFAAQSFPIRDRDVLYVANAPAAELQKFINIIGSLLYPAATLSNSISIMR
jgi:polysaccharide export outer membrane protein